jgi:hypothetical protein
MTRPRLPISAAIRRPRNRPCGYRTRCVAGFNIPQRLQRYSSALRKRFLRGLFLPQVSRGFSDTHLLLGLNPLRV